MWVVPMDNDQLECLQRAVSEIEALEAIYGSGCLTVRTPTELAAAVEAIESSATSFHVPTLKLELKIEICNLEASLHYTLPPGYPESSSVQVYMSSLSIQRSVEDELSTKLKNKATETIGYEVLMELAQYLQEMIEEVSDAEEQAPNCNEKIEKSVGATLSGFGRRWIWVHHITSTERRKSIVKEARTLHLGGFMKPGYPGIVVVEGGSCDDFVKWIKGNKSRPGGFGRNWGHHVRGEINMQGHEQRQLPLDFHELDENMKELGALCKEHGLSDEFREYVLQHKGSGDDAGSDEDK